MKLINLKELEDMNLEKLKNYYIDDASIAKFKSNIRQVSKEEADSQGKELVELLSSKSYRDLEDRDKVLNLIINGANIEYKTEKKGIFPLLVCARKNYFCTCLLLIRAGANINQVNNYLTTAAMACSKYGNLEILNVLLLLNANINMRYLDGESAIMSAKRHGNKDVFNLLVNQQAYLNIRSNSNDSINNVKGKDGDDFFLSDDMVMDSSVTVQDNQKELDGNDLISEVEQKLADISLDIKEAVKIKKI